MQLPGEASPRSRTSRRRAWPAATLMPSSSRPLTEEPRAICLRHAPQPDQEALHVRQGAALPAGPGDARRRPTTRASRPSPRPSTRSARRWRTHTQNARVAEWCCRGLQHALVDAPSRAMVTRQQNGAQLLLLVLRRTRRRPRSCGRRCTRREPERRRGRRRPRPDGAADRAERRPRGDGAGHGRAPGRRAHPGAGLRRARAARSRNAPHRREGGRRSRTSCGRSRRPTRSSTCRSTTSAATPWPAARRGRCAGDREAAEAAAKLGAPALVDRALRRFAKRASVERWGAQAKAALAGPGAAVSSAPRRRRASTSGRPSSTQSVPPRGPPAPSRRRRSPSSPGAPYRAARLSSAMAWPRPRTASSRPWRTWACGCGAVRAARGTAARASGRQPRKVRSSSSSGAVQGARRLEPPHVPAGPVHLCGNQPVRRVPPTILHEVISRRRRRRHAMENAP